MVRIGTKPGAPIVAFLAAGMLEIPLTLSFFAISGLRAAFNFPAELRANWIFQVCETEERIVHIDAAGTVTTLAEDPQGTMLAAPTNIVFAGERLDRLVSANLGRWHLTLIDSDLTGAPLHYPATWAVDS